MNKNSSIKHETQMIPILMMVILVLIGFLLIAVSIIISPGGIHGFLKELLKELGIVILAVFSVSLIYELVIAKKYFSNFISLLQKQIEKGESNGAICENIGINKIFMTRDLFEVDYPLDKTLSEVDKDSELRFVAVSLFLITTKAELLKESLMKGCKLEFAFYDPSISNKNYEEIQDLKISDIHSTVGIFKEDIIDWISQNNPKGKIEIRLHNYTLFDSFTEFKIGSKMIGIWDSSFGRSTTRKRAIVVDLHKPLGKDLHQRYDRIWMRSTRKFYYDGNKIVENSL